MTNWFVFTDWKIKMELTFKFVMLQQFIKRDNVHIH